MIKAVFYSLSIAALIACNGNEKNKQEAFVELDDIITVDRNEQGSYTLTVKGSDEWLLAYKNFTDTGNWSADQAVEDTPVIVECPDLTKRLLFRIVNPKTKRVLYASESRLIMEGAPNFRELGGIITKQGKQIRWGKFYRAGALSELSARDWQCFSTLGITTVIDFRTPDEIKREPDAFPENQKINYIHAMIGNPADMKSLGIKPSELTAAQAKNFMIKGSETFMRSVSDFKPVFDAMLTDNDSPFLFHCTAGKDRTGLSAALLLLTLDVDRDIIMQNYLLSNKYALPYYLNNSDKMRVYGFNDDVIGIIGGVDSAYLQKSFDIIDSTYGSTNELLLQAFGITPEQRAQLIEKYTY